MKKIFLIILLSIFVYSCTSEIKNGKKDIDTISQKTKKINVPKISISGKWTDKNDNSFYNFYNDSTWKHTHYFKGKPHISKGRYYIGNDGDIFLRCFGSQHWRNNGDTIQDIKTSIGARVLFLYGNVIKNNQEDYTTWYIKQ